MFWISASHIIHPEKEASIKTMVDKPFLTQWHFLDVYFQLFKKAKNALLII